MLIIAIDRIKKNHKIKEDFKLKKKLQNQELKIRK